jgi:hypothetical protein
MELIHLLQTFMWCLREKCKLITEGDMLPFILKTCAVTVRACRSVLAACLTALDRCVDWRNQQPIPNEDGFDQDDQNENGSTSLPRVTDWGALSHLADALDWVCSCATTISSYGTALKEKIALPGDLKAPPMLTRALPRDLSAVANSYRERMEVVISLYRNILDSPVSSEMFYKSEDEDSFIYGGLSSPRRNNSLRGKEFDEALDSDIPTSFDYFFGTHRDDGSAESSSSFAVLQAGNTAGKSGWGLYSYEVDDENLEYKSIAEDVSLNDGDEVEEDDEEGSDEDENSNNGVYSDEYF